MLTVQTPHRGSDDWGSGAYKASRGHRDHNGIDYVASPGSLLRSPISGTVSKLGYPYASDLSMRYIEVTDSLQKKHRFFYVLPGKVVGDYVEEGDLIGVVQDVASKYTTEDKIMKNHIHYEIKDRNGEYLNPEGEY